MSTGESRARSGSRTRAGWPWTILTYLDHGLGRADRLGVRVGKIPHPVALGTGLAVIMLAMAMLAASPTLFLANVWGDIFFALEAARHWAFGHRPHVDFHTPLGAGYVFLMGIFGRMTDFAPHTVIWVNITVAAFVTATLALVTIRRLNGPLAALCTVYWTLLALSPRRPGRDLEFINFVAAYNKWGFALLAVLWLAAAVPPRTDNRRLAIAEATCLGAVLCFLFYVKVTFFAAGLAPFLFKAMFYSRQEERRAALMPVAICGGMVLLAALAGNVSLPGYAHDVLLAARASSGLDMTRLVIDGLVNAVLVAVNLTIFLIHRRAYRNADPDTKIHAGRARALFLVLLLLALVVNNQNTSFTIPLLSLLPLTLAVTPAGDRQFLPRAVRLAMMVIPAAYFLIWSSIELRSIGFHYRAAAAGEGTPFCTRTDLSVCRMRITESRPEKPAFGLTYAETSSYHDDLYAVLDPLVTPQSRIVTFTFSNMLNARYDLEPVRGGLLFWHFRRNFDETSRPEARELFKDATLVVVPRHLLPNAHDTGMKKIYGDYVRAHFVIAAQTSHWTVYARS